MHLTITTQELESSDDNRGHLMLRVSDLQTTVEDLSRHKNVAEIIKQHCRIHTAAVKKHGATARGDGASRKGAGLQRRKSPGKSSEAGAAEITTRKPLAFDGHLTAGHPRLL